MSNEQTSRTWMPNGQVAVGTDLEGEHLVIGLYGEEGSFIRLAPQHALALATAIRATAKRLTRREGKSGG